MIIVDKALERREAEDNPLRVALIGAGFAGRGVAQQLLTPLAGMRLSAIVNRTVPKACKLFEEHGMSCIVADTALQVEEALSCGHNVVTDDIASVCGATQIDVIVDTTGQVEYGARVALSAIENRKPLVMANAELDATLGPILKRKADAAGVTISNTDGDEPAVAMNLVRFVRTIGLRPVMAGNIKGFLDPHRNPETQEEFARRVGQQPAMIVSFADGTKLSLECAILANATGLGVGSRGMTGHAVEHVMDLPSRLSADELLAHPQVDYVLGAKPGNGAFVVVHSEQPIKRQYLQYFKMGDGPLYLFYTPYHLPPFQLPATIGRVALLGDAAVAPLGRPVADSIAMAKRDLAAGTVLDGIGGFDCYGVIEDAQIAIEEVLLPMGIAGGCRLVRDVRQDEPLTRSDIELPPNRLSDQLRAEQDAWLAEASAKEAITTKP